MRDKPEIGTIVWRDLTVKDAEGIRDFYCEVVGWQAAPHNMGDYDDFDIKTPDSGEVVTGICHAQAANAHIPPAWLLYVAVADVEASAARCVALGGKVLDGPRPMGESRFCVIQDPAGAVMGLMS
ncbi:MAG: VOC family protein [Ardenticatenaceae bacterium]|nr:VOC family protein [Ardenticatenaceae bacterium]